MKDSKQSTNFGYDETKRMLNLIRRITESTKTFNVIKEQTENTPEQVKSNLDTDITVINDVNINLQFTDQMDNELTEEQKNSISEMIDLFRQTVSNLAELDPGMTINPDEIRLDGVLPEIDTRFTFVAGNNAGLYTTTQMTKVTQEMIDMYNKLNKFYTSFVDSMNNIITQRKNN